MASIKIRGKKGVFHAREGENIVSLGRIQKVYAKKLILRNKNTGLCEFVLAKKTRSSAPRRPSLRLERNLSKAKKLLKKNHHSGIRVTGGNKFAIKKALRDEMLGNINEVLTQARAVQIKNPDGSLSFRIQEIVPGSIYSKLNIENGDIVTGINGKKFTNVNEIMSLFGQLKEKDHYEISVLRNGMEQTLEYNFE